MKATENPLVELIEESIRLRDCAQEILSEPFADYTLTRLEGLTLLALTESGKRLTVPQIGRNLGHSRQVIQRAVKRLEELGLVEKLSNPDHKTADLIVPTKAGQDYDSELAQRLRSTVESLFTETEMKSCKRITRELRKFRAVIEASIERKTA